MNSSDRTNASAAQTKKAGTVQSKAEAAREKAKNEARHPSGKTQEMDDKQLAKGKALRK